MATIKRHIYPAGTVNVETGDLATKQDINYFTSKVQSVTRSIVRLMEDMDKRFSQNQIYDGLTVSNGGATVDVASGTAKVGGRWISVDADNISAAIADDTYNIILAVSGVSETSTRDPSSGETFSVFLESSGSWADDDFKLVLGSAVISSSTVDSVQDRAKRQYGINIIKPYGDSTQVSIYTGTKPVYREAIRFTSNQILPYNPIVSEFAISGTAISGTTLNISGNTILNGLSLGDISGSSLDITGDADVDGDVTIGGTIQASGTSSEVVDLSGSSFSAADYAIGSNVIGLTEFQNLVGLNQQLDSAKSPSFVIVTSSQASPTPPFIVASTGTVINFSADKVDGFDLDQALLIASSPSFVQITSSVAGGTPPFIVTSPTLVTNLNVDKVDGFDLDQEVASGSLLPSFKGIKLDGGSGFGDARYGDLRPIFIIASGTSNEEAIWGVDPFDEDIRIGVTKTIVVAPYAHDLTGATITNGVLVMGASDTAYITLPYTPIIDSGDTYISAMFFLGTLSSSAGASATLTADIEVYDDTAGTWSVADDPDGELPNVGTTTSIPSVALLITGSGFLFSNLIQRIDTGQQQYLRIKLTTNVNVGTVRLPHIAIIIGENVTNSSGAGDIKDYDWS